MFQSGWRTIQRKLSRGAPRCTPSPCSRPSSERARPGRAAREPYTVCDLDATPRTKLATLDLGEWRKCRLQGRQETVLGEADTTVTQGAPRGFRVLELRDEARLRSRPSTRDHTVRGVLDQALFHVDAAPVVKAGDVVELKHRSRPTAASTSCGWPTVLMKHPTKRRPPCRTPPLRRRRRARQRWRLRGRRRLRAARLYETSPGLRVRSVCWLDVDTWAGCRLTRPSRPGLLRPAPSFCPFGVGRPRRAAHDRRARPPAGRCDLPPRAVCVCLGRRGWALGSPSLRRPTSATTRGADVRPLNAFASPIKDVDPALRPTWHI